jgi:hypothetical protein
MKEAIFPMGVKQLATGGKGHEQTFSTGNLGHLPMFFADADDTEAGGRFRPDGNETPRRYPEKNE